MAARGGRSQLGVAEERRGRWWPAMEAEVDRARGDARWAAAPPPRRGRTVGDGTWGRVVGARWVTADRFPPPCRSPSRARRRPPPLAQPSSNANGFSCGPYIYFILFFADWIFTSAPRVCHIGSKPL